MHNSELKFHRVIDNDVTAILHFVSELKLLAKFTISKTVFCLEETGIYGNHVLSALKKLKASIALENARHIKLSLGLIRGKYDKIDAIRIAQYAAKHVQELRFWQPERLPLQSLKSLFSLRTRILNVQKILATPLKEQKNFLAKTLHKRIVLECSGTSEAVKKDIQNIDNSMDQVIANDERLKNLFQKITSVDHVGRITAIQMLICTNEFLDIKDPKKFACYAGVAPFKAESGLFKSKAKVSPIANKKMKSLLHICAMGAIQKDGELKDYYIRKTQRENKPKMMVINAVRNKLIHRIFSCVNNNRLFEKTFMSDRATILESSKAQQEGKIEILQQM